MFTRRTFTVLAATCVLGSAAATTSAAPQLVTFNISSGSLVLGGQFGGNTPSPQPGTTFSVGYTGTIAAEVDNVAHTIRFLGGSSIAAGLQPSNVEPRNDNTPGFQPGNYGRAGNVDFAGNPLEGAEAIRGLVLDIENGDVGATIAYSPSTGQFSNANTGILIDVGRADYRVGGILFNQADLFGPGFASNGALTPSTLTSDGVTETLTLHIQSGALTHSVVQANDSSVTFTGTLTATRAIPEPASIGTLALGAIGVLARRRRRD
jgi:hypothetical protein